MELKVKSMTFPEAIEFNFDELKQEITERASSYVDLVYTEDQIKDAKKDVANLRKFTKALSDERIRIKKQCLQPYEDFEAKIKVLSGIVDEAITNIDAQVKGYEEQEKARKLDSIKELWGTIEHPAEMTFEHVFEGKFLNKSVSMATVEQYMKNSVKRFKNDLATLQNLPEFSFEAVEVYKQTLDMHKAISEGKRLAEIQKKKVEAHEAAKRLEAEREAALERQQAEETTAPPEAQHMLPPASEAPVEPQKQWISFKALLSVEDATALKQFFEARNIQFEAI